MANQQTDTIQWVLYSLICNLPAAVMEIEEGQDLDFYIKKFTNPHDRFFKCSFKKAFTIT